MEERCLVHAVGGANKEKGLRRVGLWHVDECDTKAAASVTGVVLREHERWD